MSVELVLQKSPLRPTEIGQVDKWTSIERRKHSGWTVWYRGEWRAYGNFIYRHWWNETGGGILPQPDHLSCPCTEIKMKCGPQEVRNVGTLLAMKTMSLTALNGETTQQQWHLYVLATPEHYNLQTHLAMTSWQSIMASGCSFLQIIQIAITVGSTRGLTDTWKTHKFSPFGSRNNQYEAI